MENATEQLLKELEPEELIRSEDEKIVLNFKKPNSEVKIEDSLKSKPMDIKSERQKTTFPAHKPSISRKSNKPSTSKRSALDQIRDDEERFKEKKNRKDYWLHEGIVVKVVTKQLGSQFYKAKGKVIEVVDKFVAEVELDNGDVIRLDQKFLETVIPSVGRDMLVVNGAYRGEKTVLEEIIEKKFMVRLRVTKGVRNGRILEIPYEDASKFVS